MKGLVLHKRKRSESSKNDNWWTPSMLRVQLGLIHDMKFGLDVAADLNSTQAGWFFTKEMDALSRDWVCSKNNIPEMGKLSRITKTSVTDVWCNPPNKKLGLFIRKAYEQYIKFQYIGLRIMMITPANVVSSHAWWDCVENPKDEGENIFYKPIFKRIEFLENGGKPQGGARNAYLTVIWGR